MAQALVGSDGLSSVSEALDSSRTVTAQQLYAPYGSSRYSNGSMPMSKGFTGKRADSGSSGLDYYGARYNDAVVGRFTSADSVLGADPFRDAYAYVGGMVERATDPSGHMEEVESESV